MTLVGWIVFGLITGFVASRVVHQQGQGCILNVVLGIIGAVIGGFIFTTIGGQGITGFNVYSMFVAALVQYNSTAHTVSSNVRFRWEYQPGSELFVVWNDQRSTAAPAGIPSLQNRAFIVKVNRLLRF